MEKKNKLLIALIISITVLGSVFIPLSIRWSQIESYVEGNHIEITNDKDFWKYDFKGKGTSDNPYLIENYFINTTANNAIKIATTTKHFIIRNCVLQAKENAIYIDNVKAFTATIINNICNNQDYGILIKESSDLVIEENTCNNNKQTGIRLLFCPSADIKLNNCSKNFSGISIYQRDTINNYLFYNIEQNNIDDNYFGVEINCGYSYEQVILSKNNITNNVVGTRIFADDSIYEENFIAYNEVGISVISNVYDNKIRNNTFVDNLDFGLYDNGGQRTEIVNNSFINCGIHFTTNNTQTLSLLTIDNNTINTKKFGLFFNDSSQTITSPEYGQICLINCFNMTISNQIIDNANLGIRIEDCNNITLTNNTISNNFENIGIYRSQNIIVENNTCSNAQCYGIYFYRCNIAFVFKNKCVNNYYYGVFTCYSNYMDFYNNTISKNSYGFFVIDNENSTFVFNLFTNNTDYGIYSDNYFDNNYIYYNSFIDNNINGTSQAYDFYSSSTWHNTSSLIGNYWSDWIGSGGYSVAGYFGTTSDPYPLSNPIYP